MDGLSVGNPLKPHLQKYNNAMPSKLSFSIYYFHIFTSSSSMRLMLNDGRIVGGGVNNP
jgi:hypothetical protein